MDLGELRAEVNARGFTTPTFTDARINQLLNDAQNFVARRCNYWVNESSDSISTVSGTASYAWPSDLGRVREVFGTDEHFALVPVGLRQIDRSLPANGRPYFYALDGGNIHLYPTPDNVYTLTLRYWAIPTAMSSDSDTPNLPTDWHHILWTYVVWKCFEADDDSALGPYWKNEFNQLLAEFEADQKFISSEYPWQASGMWGEDAGLSPTGDTWIFWGGAGGGI